MRSPLPELGPSFPRMGYPITPQAKAAAYDLRASDVQAISVADAAEFDITSEAFVDTSSVPENPSVETIAVAEARASTSCQVTSTCPQAKATAFPRARAATRASRGRALESSADDVTSAWRLECMDCPSGNVVMNQQPSVLVDSGADETIRPWHADIKESGCTHTAVVTASGDRVAALRTRDGELRITSSDDSRDWFLVAECSQACGSRWILHMDA